MIAPPLVVGLALTLMSAAQSEAPAPREASEAVQAEGGGDSSGGDGDGDGDGERDRSSLGSGPERGAANGDAASGEGDGTARDLEEAGAGGAATKQVPTEVVVSDRESPVDEAQRHLEGGSLHSAIDATQSGRMGGGLESEALIRTYEIEAQAWAQLGDGIKATKAWSIVQRLDRGRAAPAGLDAPSAATHRAALKALPEVENAFLMHASWVGLSASGPGIQVRLVADDLQLVAAVVVLEAGERAGQAPLSSGSPLAFVASTAEVEALEALALDENDNELMAVKVIQSGAVPVSTDDESDAPIRWLTLGGVAVMAVGGAALVGSGMGLAALDRQGQLEDIYRYGLLGALAASAGVIGVGGGLVVLDWFIFPPPERDVPESDDSDGDGEEGDGEEGDGEEGGENAGEAETQSDGDSDSEDGAAPRDSPGDSAGPGQQRGEDGGDESDDSGRGGEEQDDDDDDDDGDDDDDVDGDESRRQKVAVPL